MHGSRRILGHLPQLLPILSYERANLFRDLFRAFNGSFVKSAVGEVIPEFGRDGERSFVLGVDRAEGDG